MKKNIRESKFFFPKKVRQVKKQTGLLFGLPITIAIAIAIAIAITHGYPYA